MTEEPPERSEQINFRCSADLKARVEKAAIGCAMSIAQWGRAVMESACEMAEADDEEPGDVGEGEGTDEAEPEDPEPTDWEEYDRRVQEAAKAERDRLLAEQDEVKARVRAGQPAQAKRDPHDCPHFPSHRRGTICGDCGMRIAGAGRMSGLGLGSRTGRF